MICIKRLCLSLRHCLYEFQKDEVVLLLYCRHSWNLLTSFVCELEESCSEFQMNSIVFFFGHLGLPLELARVRTGVGCCSDSFFISEFEIR